MCVWEQTRRKSPKASNAEEQEVDHLIKLCLRTYGPKVNWLKPNNYTDSLIE